MRMKKAGLQEKRIIPLVQEHDKIARNVYEYCELVTELTRKTITVCYKQAHPDSVWVVLCALALMLIFTLVQIFVGIDSGTILYPTLTFAALMPCIFFLIPRQGKFKAW